MAVVRLQCPACAAIVNISEQLAAQHPVVRCGQCQGLVQVVEHRLPEKTVQAAPTEKPRIRSGTRRSSKNQFPVSLVVYSILGVLAFIGAGVGVFFLVTALSTSDAERSLKQSLALFDRCIKLFEGINSADDVPGAYDQLIKIGTELKDIASRMRDMKVDHAESERLRVKYEQALKDKIQNMMAVALKLGTKPGVIAALEKYEREHGFGLKQLSGGLNFAGGPFGNAPSMPRMPGNSPADNGNTVPVKPLEPSEQLQFEMTLGLKRSALQNIVDSLERVTDSSSLDFSIVSVRPFLDTATQSKTKIEALEQKSIQPSSAMARQHLRQIERLEVQLSMQLARLERMSDVAPRLSQLKTSLTSAGIVLTRSSTETANNGTPANTASNPFEPASGGGNVARGGNTPPANPFEPATGSNGGNSGNNPFEPAPSKTGGSMPARGASSLDDTIGKLTSTDGHNRRVGFMEIQSAKVEEERRKEVLDALFGLFDDREVINKSDILKVYRKWAATQEQKERLGTIAEVMLKEHFIKKEMLRYYGDNKISSASKEVARLLKEVFDRKEAAECLIAIGSDAEPAVIPYLNDLDNQVRHMAIEVLARIGTKNCLPDLQRLQNDRFVGLAARQAVKIISARK